MATVLTSPVRILPFGISENDYPVEARSRDIQGDAEYSLEIDVAGRPTSCRIKSTAGDSALDRATCQVAMRARFTPAMDDQGRPVPGLFDDWIMWNLADGTPTHAQGHSVDVRFDGAGDVVACRVNRILPAAVLTIAVLKRCETLGSAKVFADFLGRSTAGLKSAAIRTYTTSIPSEHFDSGADLRRELAVVEYDQTRSGAITRCQMIVSPIIPGGTPSRDLCGPGGFQTTSPAGKQSVTTKRFTVDAVATLIH